MAVAGGLGLSMAGMAGCAAGSDSTNGKPTLRYGFWGDNLREQNYNKALKQFSQQNPDIQMQPEFAAYTAFQERMTTEIAARNVPEIFWIASPQVMTYSKNGLYRQLDNIPTLSLSAYSPADLDSFKLDGKLNNMPFGIYTPVIRYNETFAQEDGVAVPVEGSPGWTWDGCAQFLIDYSKNNKKQRRGMPYRADHDLSFEAWLRQRGEQLWTQDGRMGFTVDALAGWFDWWEKLRKAGAVMSLGEQNGLAFDWAAVGNKVLANVGNSNNIVDEAKIFPTSRFRLRGMPVDLGTPDGYKFLYYARMAIYQNIDSSKVDAAGKMIDYNTNKTDLLKVVGLTLGVPVNPQVAEQAVSFANRDEQEMLALVAKDRAAPRRPRYEAPAGSSSWRSTMSRVVESIALGKSSVADGARQMVNEIQAALERAK